jgi:hypothetical protein
MGRFYISVVWKFIPERGDITGFVEYADYCILIGFSCYFDRDDSLCFFSTDEEAEQDYFYRDSQYSYAECGDCDGDLADAFVY